jgi:hypothetical protein
VSSRLALDAYGRRIAVVTAPAVGLDVGDRFLVLGDALPCAEPGFMFTGTSTGRSPLPGENPRRNGTVSTQREPPRKWTEAHREEARQLQLEGVSWSSIAEQVCGNKRYKATVGLWLKRDAIPGDAAAR